MAWPRSFGRHAAFAFAFATGVAADRPFAAAPLNAAAAAVANSCVHTGVHYPADVIAGSLVGGSLAPLAVALRRRPSVRPRCARRLRSSTSRDSKHPTWLPPFSAGSAASRPARAPSVRVLADRASDAGAKPAPNRRRTARCGNPRTNPHRARSSGSAGGRWPRHGGWRAVRARSHSIRHGRI